MWHTILICVFCIAIITLEIFSLKFAFKTYNLIKEAEADHIVTKDEIKKCVKSFLIVLAFFVAAIGGFFLMSFFGTRI